MFYTNVFKRGNKLFLKGYDKGLRVNQVIDYKPYLFLPNANGTYQTIKGEKVEKKEFDSMSSARDFIEQYKDVSNFKYYGITNFEYLYINDNFKGDIDYNVSWIKVGNIDIECAADEGFPDITQATKEITAITLRCRGRNYVFGCGDFTTDDVNTHYLKCKDEYDLLISFLDCWEKLDLDIVTGWNCIPINQNVWGIDRITSILNAPNKLHGSDVKNRSPISKKQEYVITLSNGQKFSASKDHKLMVRCIDGERYTKLKLNFKNEGTLVDKVLTVEECINSKENLFVDCVLRYNQNKDQDYTDASLYLAGLIYTDGTIRNKSKKTDGYRIYQSDEDMMNNIIEKFNISTELCGPYKGCYNLSIKNSLLIDSHNLIYDNEGNKKLNVEKLSELSYRQFMIFLSGLLDGDGCISSGKGIQWCNYNNDVDSLQQLLQWNGMFSIQQSKHILRLVDFKYDDLTLMKNKRWENISVVPLSRNTSQKAELIRFKRVHDTYLVKIVDIKKTDNIIDMMDIETSDHKFITNGVEVHNCEFFDFPYLINRMKNLFDSNIHTRLSPWKTVNEKITKHYAKEQQTYTIAGVSILDYYQLYRKFTFGNQESYKLDFIAELEVGEKKIDYKKYGSLINLYRNNYQKFIEYNIHDVILVDKIDNKLKFLEQVMALAYDAKVNYIDTLTTVRPWDIIIHNYLMERRIVVPQMETHYLDRALIGGHVKEPIPGLYKWVVSIDLNSLYPHLIMQYNISPETFVSRMSEDLYPSMSDLISGNTHDMSLYAWTANGCAYRKDKQGFLPYLMETMYNDRVKYKKMMIEAKKELEAVEAELNKRKG